MPARIEVIRRRLSRRFTQRDFGTECRVLLETIHDEMRDHLLYRYPNEKAAVLTKWKADWAPAIAAFPSAAQDILAAVDLWAMAHPTSCVFHLMRVVEHGLRAVAHDVGLTFDVQQWHIIIERIEKAVRSEGDKLPKGLPKNERLEFLSQAAKEFYFFKEGWRNHVSHGRAHYDEHQARTAMEHTRAFMNHISSRLSERPADGSDDP